MIKCGQLQVDCACLRPFQQFVWTGLILMFHQWFCMPWPKPINASELQQTMKLFANTIARENCLCLRLCVCQQIQLLKRGMLNRHSKYALRWHWEPIMKQIWGASHKRTVHHWDSVWDYLGAGACVVGSTFILSPQHLFRQFLFSSSFSPGPFSQNLLLLLRKMIQESSSMRSGNQERIHTFIKDSLCNRHFVYIFLFNNKKDLQKCII